MKTLVVLTICVTLGYSRVLEDNNIFHTLWKYENELQPQEVKSEGKHWALIVAGSAGWYNYRHQADACHAYHVIQSHGIPAENIVLMMFDDIAQNEENPTPGIVINHPDGDDVYGGVTIDYRREDVTPDNFLAIMRGDKEAMAEIGSGRVIESGPNDHVFVNFVDHGAPGILGFPSDMLHVKPFMKTIEDMASQQKFKQLVFYIEACESGSMFENLLPENINVWATTAANGKESSYACYFDKERKTYLGDVYSVKWMEDSDVEDLSKESLHKQFKIVKQETNTSHVQQFGDKTISKESVSEFQGGQKYVAPTPKHVPKASIEDAVASEDVPMAILRNVLANAQDFAEEQATLEKMKLLKKHNAHIDDVMQDITRRALGNSNMLPEYLFGVRHDLTNYECYQQSVDYLHHYCFPVSNDGYAMKRLYMLVNLCEEGISTDAIFQAIDGSCVPAHEPYL